MPSYVFFGFETDAELTGYLYELINHAMGTELEAFRRVHPHLRATRLRSASKSFQQGMAARIADRLDDMHQARDATVADDDLPLAKYAEDLPVTYKLWI